MKKFPLIPAVAIILLTALTTCKNPMVTALLTAPAELDNITLAAADTSGNDAELNYGLQPNFVKGIREYYVMVPRNTGKVTIKGISSKAADIIYKMTTTGNSIARDDGIFYDFEFPEKSCKVELTVNMAGKDTSVYTLTIYRMMPAWITKMEFTTDVGGDYLYPFSPGYNPSILDYTVGVNFNAGEFSLKCFRRNEYAGDSEIGIEFQNENGTTIPTENISDLNGNYTKNIDPIPFPYDPNNQAQTMMEKIVFVVVSFPQEDPKPAVYTLKIRRPARVTALTGVVHKDEDCFTISGAEKDFYFQQGEPVTFTVTPPFGYSRTGVSASSAGRPVTLFQSGLPPTVYDMATYSFIMPGNDVVLSGQWAEIPRASYTNVRYVLEYGAGDGSQWCKASGDLQRAIDEYTGSGSGNYEIWIAAGTVTPIWSWVNGVYPKPNWASAFSAGSNFTNWDHHCFVLKNGVKIYGGFKGTEITLTDKNNRDINVNQTLLSGYREDEGYVRHLMAAVGINQPTLVESVTITNAEAGGRETNITINNETLDAWAGGGIVTAKCTNDLVFNKVSVVNNFTMYGAGARNTDSSPTFFNCYFSGNSAYSSGGGIFNDGNSEPIIENCTITGNQAGTTSGTLGFGTGGGGIANANTSAPIIKNCIISENFAGTTGGGIHSGAYAAAPVIINSKIFGNQAIGSGGGIYHNGSGIITMVNTLITGNNTPINAGGVYAIGPVKIINATIVQNTGNCDLYASNAASVIRNTIAWGSSTNSNAPTAYTFQDNRIQTSGTGPGEIPPGTTLSQLGLNGNYIPTVTGAPPLCKNAGDIGAYDEPWFPNYDLAGSARIVGGEISIGAYQ